MRKLVLRQKRGGTHKKKKLQMLILGGLDRGSMWYTESVQRQCIHMVCGEYTQVYTGMYRERIQV